ncbi:MAG: hypothetical protein ACKOC5_04480, partial [Chloroflexota bacterium]
MTQAAGQRVSLCAGKTRPAGRLAAAGLLLLPLLTGCGSLPALEYLPPHTPARWLEIQPYLEFQLAGRTHYLVQPSTSAIVYLLGLVCIAAGWVFLRPLGAAARVDPAARWWGIALLLWGVGALLAGTSYEAFSYAIKCAGWQTCRWTSAWEVLYLLCSAASVDAMVTAVAWRAAAGRLQRAVFVYAAVNLAVYAALLGLGTWIPVRFLLSFELLLVAAAPGIAACLLLNARRWRRLRQPLDRSLLFAWAWLALTIAAYFLYLLSGLTARLWARGVWFSENDVLHLGL